MLNIKVTPKSLKITITTVETTVLKQAVSKHKEKEGRLCMTISLIAEELKGFKIMLLMETCNMNMISINSTIKIILEVVA